MSKRPQPLAQARGATEALSGRKTMQEIAPDHTIHRIQARKWKRQPNSSAHFVQASIGDGLSRQNCS
jgi:transposase-like protein